MVISRVAKVDCDAFLEPTSNRRADESFLQDLLLLEVVEELMVGLFLPLLLDGTQSPSPQLVVVPAVAVLAKGTSNDDDACLVGDLL